MVLEKHLTINLPEHLVTMRRLLQDVECKKQGFAPKQSRSSRGFWIATSEDFRVIFHSQFASF
jgi:hypothetical protein